MTRIQRVFLVATLITCALAIVLYANSAGADAGYSGAPTDQNCSECHTSNTGVGNVKIVFPNGPFYVPGQLQHLQVVVSDNIQSYLWGFQLASRLGTNTSSQAGTFTPWGDGNTQVVCDSYNSSSKTPIDPNKEVFGQNPCPNNLPLQWIEQTSQGNLGTPGSGVWNLDWTPPSSNVGSINMYIASVASNGSNDKVYTNHYTLTVAAAGQPAIAANGVVNGASFQNTAIAPNSWVTIYGTNLAPDTRPWASYDFINGRLPNNLDGVTVTIDNKTAYVAYISPTQINVLAPPNISIAPNLVVQVTNNGVQSLTGQIAGQSQAPAFFEWNGMYAVATHTDFTPAAPASVVPGGTPAKPGDTIILWATGLGSTNPTIPAGIVTPNSLVTVNIQPTVMIGGIAAHFVGAALAPGYVGLFQVAVQVPDGVSTGDQPIVIQSGTVPSPSGVFLNIATP